MFLIKPLPRSHKPWYPSHEPSVAEASLACGSLSSFQSFSCYIQKKAVQTIWIQKFNRQELLIFRAPSLLLYFFSLFSLTNAPIQVSRQSLGQVAIFSALKAIWENRCSRVRIITNYKLKSGLEQEALVFRIYHLRWIKLAQVSLPCLRPAVSFHSRGKDGFSWTICQLQWYILENAHTDSEKPGYSKALASADLLLFLTTVCLLVRKVTATRSIFCVVSSHGLWCWGGKRTVGLAWAW